MIEAGWKHGIDGPGCDQQFMPAAIHLAACSVAEHVDRTIRILASTGTNLTRLQKVIESASQRRKPLNDAVERRTHGRIADVSLDGSCVPFGVFPVLIVEIVSAMAARNRGSELS